MTYNLVKIARAPVMVCLQCPLCCNLVHEATTISECLHTFCRDCIYQRLGDGESDCCPICNVNLGCSPLEKLRADHQLDDVRAKIFPIKMKKRKVIDNNLDCDAPAPVRRKERSLSSLGIGAAPPSANPGFVSRRTKSVSRRSMTIRDTSADNDYEDKKPDTLKSKSVGAERDGSEEGTQGDLQDEFSSDDKVGTVSEENQESLTSAKREMVSDEEKETTEVDAIQHKAEKLLCRRGMLPHGPQDQLRVPDHSSNGVDPLSKLGLYLAERSKVSATGLLHAHGTQVSGQPDKSFGKHKKVELYNGDDQKLPTAFSVVRERTGKGLKRRSALAQLAELAVGEAVESSKPFKSRGPRARRGKGRSENLKTPAGEENLNWHSGEIISNVPGSQLQPNFPPVAKSSPLAKLPVRKMASSKRTPANTASIARQDERNAGFWFALQAADNQMGENALPQISKRYLHIEDGKLPVSIVKKYLVKKLDLKSETEVEVTCRGQPVVPNLPLESVQGIWFATMPSSNMPSLKEVKAASNDRKKCGQFRSSSAEDYMMVLTYGRHRRPLMGH